RAQKKLGWAIGVAIAASASPSRRSSAAVDRGLDLQYDVAENCPDADWFRARVTGRTARAKFAKGGNPVALSAKPEGNGYRGLLVVSQDYSGKVERRSVDGETCEEVVDAPALVTALSIDPDASLEVPGEPPVPSNSASPAPPIVSTPSPVSHVSTGS